MDHSLVFQKAYDAYRLIADLTVSFPKKDRYSLGVRLETQALELIELIVTAEVTADALKDRTLVSATAKADVCAILARLALERKFIRETNYFTLVKTFKEIAKMTVGWRKSLNRR